MKELLRKEERKQRRWILIGVIGLIIGVGLLGYSYGNKIFHTAETCKVKSVTMEESWSNGGGFPSLTQSLDVESTNCPEIIFFDAPSGVDSLAAFKNELHPGKTYDFQIGIFRQGHAGSTEGEWIGAGVDLSSEK